MWRSDIALRVLCGVVGTALSLIALNTAIDGMATLGWQFPSDFMDITDQTTFARHDSNARFFAATFMCFGIFMALGAIWLDVLWPVITAFLIAIAFGGLLRFLQNGYSPLADPEILPSLIAEVVLGPLFAYWIYRSRNSGAA